MATTDATTITITALDDHLDLARMRTSERLTALQNEGDKIK